MRLHVDTLIVNAEIITLSSVTPTAYGLAIHNGKIVATLQPGDELNFDATVVIDVHQKTIIPGLIDSHSHLQAIISEHFSIQIPRELQTNTAFYSFLKEKISTIPSGEWIRISGYHPFHFPEVKPLTMEVLNQLSTSHPIRVRYVTRHTSVLNSEAWQQMMIKYPFSYMEGVYFEYDKENKPNGIIHGADTYLSEYIVSKIPPSKWLSAIKKLQLELLSYGITAIQDASPTTSQEQLEIWLKAENQFWIIPIKWMSGSKYFDTLPQILENSNLYERGALKIVLEAAPEIYPEKHQIEQILFKAGLTKSTVAIHVVTPEMIWHVLDALQSVRKKNPNLYINCRLEHVSLCPKAFIEEMLIQQVMVVTNPPFLFKHGDRYLSQVEENEQNWLYPIQSFIEKGFVVAAGADAPVAPISPWLGMYAACTRKSADGQVINLKESVSRDNALQLYTTGGAQVGQWENRLGKLQLGFDATFLILENNPLTCTLHQLKDMKVLETWIQGRKHYTYY